MTLRLENVMGCSTGSGKGQPTSIQVVMVYNPNCSKNAYKYRDGRIKQDVKDWMNDLAWMISAWSRSSNITWKPPLHILIGGTFKDKRSTPDIHNFCAVINDSIQDGLGVNDQQYQVETALPRIDPSVEPRIAITITQGEADDTT